MHADRIQVLKLSLFLSVDLRQLIESERTNSREREHLGSQGSPSSVSNSYYTDSYLEGSKDETTSSSNGTCESVSSIDHLISSP